MGMVVAVAAHHLHRRLVERRERDDVEVAHVPRRDRVAPAARRAHRADEREVDEAAERVLFAVVPARVIHPLPQQLDRRLQEGGNGRG